MNQPKTTFTKDEVEALDLRRQEQIKNQTEIINRLQARIAELEAELEADDDR